MCSSGKESGKKAPPPRAPAHGHRAKHRYYYYPSAFVYFDIDRGVYFYLEGSTWRMVTRPPAVILSVPDEYIVIELDTDKPYIFFNEHKRKYPPGQLKKEHKKNIKRSINGKMVDNIRRSINDQRMLIFC